MGETETAGSRFAVALATFGAACVLVAAAAILRPLADGTSVGAAVVSAALFIGAVVAAAHFGADDQGAVPRAIADVFAAGSVLFLVWSQGRDLYTSEPGTLAVSRDARDLFALPPRNTIAVKESNLSSTGR